MDEQITKAVRLLGYAGFEGLSSGTLQDFEKQIVNARLKGLGAKARIGSRVNWDTTCGLHCIDCEDNPRQKVFTQGYGFSSYCSNVAHRLAKGTIIGAIIQGYKIEYVIKFDIANIKKSPFLPRFLPKELFSINFFHAKDFELLVEEKE